MKTREDKIYSFFGHLIMTILTLLAIIPILLMFISSLTDNATLLQNGYSFLPEKWSTYAYEWVFTSSSSMVIKAYGMSFILTATGVVCSLALTTCLAYGLSKKGLPGRNVLTFLVFFTMLFNGGLVPTYINYTTVFHVKDTFFGLLVPSLMMSAFNVLLMKSYFVTGVPDEILEAAYIDGANEFQTMWKIAIPLSKPIITTVAMFSGIAYWNDKENGSLQYPEPAEPSDAEYSGADAERQQHGAGRRRPLPDPIRNGSYGDGSTWYSADHDHLSVHPEKLCKRYYPWRREGLIKK